MSLYAHEQSVTKVMCDASVSDKSEKEGVIQTISDKSE